jgi:hypothetical protein
LGALSEIRDGEIYKTKISLMKLNDIVSVIAPQAVLQLTRISPSKKLHERTINIEDTPSASFFHGYFRIILTIVTGQQFLRGSGWAKKSLLFSCISDSNEEWMIMAQHEIWISETKAKIGEI